MLENLIPPSDPKIKSSLQDQPDIFVELSRIRQDNEIALKVLDNTLSRLDALFEEHRACAYDI